jgi:hypothetical protein
MRPLQNVPLVILSTMENLKFENSAKSRFVILSEAKDLGFACLLRDSSVASLPQNDS